MCDRQQRLRRTWDGERSIGTVLNKIFLLGQLYPHLVSGNLCQDHVKWKQCWSWHCCSPLGFLAACHLPKGNMPSMEEQLLSASQCNSVKVNQSWVLGRHVAPPRSVASAFLKVAGRRIHLASGLQKVQGRKEMAHSTGSVLICQKYISAMLQMKSFCLEFLYFLQLCDSKLVHLLTGFTYGCVEVWSPNFCFYLKTISNMGSLGKGNESGLNSSVGMCLPNPWFQDSGKHVRVTNW